MAGASSKLRHQAVRFLGVKPIEGGVVVEHGHLRYQALVMLFGLR